MSMSCKAANDLIRLLSVNDLTLGDKSLLMTHIQSCNSCSERVRQERFLNELFENTDNSYDSHLIPINVMRSRVEHQLNEKNDPAVPSLWAFRLEWITAASAALVLLLAFYTDYTGNPEEESPVIGSYEVALDGVSIEMIENEDTICDLFFKNGLLEASYDLIECQSTCKLLVFNLNSIEEAARVVNLFHSLDNSDIKTNVMRIENDQTQVI